MGGKKAKSLGWLVASSRVILQSNSPGSGEWLASGTEDHFVFVWKVDLTAAQSPGSTISTTEHPPTISTEDPTEDFVRWKHEMCVMCVAWDPTPGRQRLATSCGVSDVGKAK